MASSITCQFEELERTVYVIVLSFCRSTWALNNGNVNEIEYKKLSTYENRKTFKSMLILYSNIYYLFILLHIYVHSISARNVIFLLHIIVYYMCLIIDIIVLTIKLFTLLQDSVTLMFTYCCALTKNIYCFPLPFKNLLDWEKCPTILAKPILNVYSTGY